MQNPDRRQLMRTVAGALAASTLPAWAQLPKTAPGSRICTVAQVVDVSVSQIDVSKDFLIGSRAAWQDINARGGLRGKTVQHLVLEVDGSAASLRAAVQTLKNQPQCVALSGSVGDHAAAQLTDLLQRELPDVAHVAPWLQNATLDAASNTFPIFASRQEQVAHAIKSLSVMGITEVGAIYGSAAEYASYRQGVDEMANTLKLRLKSYSPVANLQQLGKTLTPDSPRVLLFLGGTPELVQFSQGIEKQAAQRYIIAMSDVNLQTMLQMGVSRFTPVIATQVVPMVNANLPIVKSFRDTLGRLYDEPPTPQSLAGYIAARYTYEVLQGIDGAPTRLSALQAFQKRSTVDLGGFRIAPDTRSRGTAYVTQSMISTDGRLLG